MDACRPAGSAGAASTDSTRTRSTMDRSWRRPGRPPHPPGRLDDVARTPSKAPTASSGLELTRRACGEKPPPSFVSTTTSATDTMAGSSETKKNLRSKNAATRTSGPLDSPGRNVVRHHRYQTEYIAGESFVIRSASEETIASRRGLPRPLCVRGDIRLLELAPCGSAATRWLVRASRSRAVRVKSRGFAARREACLAPTAPPCAT